jgi:Ser/Thr protein kinase RdoA (MazF antagonist)
MTGDPKAHGLDGSLVAPDWPPLAMKEVERLLERYPQVGKVERILSISPRPFSAASVIEVQRGKVFVKRHHRTVRTRDALLEEHHLLTYLNQRDALINGVLKDSSGETAISLGDWTYEVQPVAAGVDVYEEAQSWTPFLNPWHARAAGRALARLHRAAEGYDAPARKSKMLVTSFSIFEEAGPWPRLQQFVEERPALGAYLKGKNWQQDAKDTFQKYHADLLPFLEHLAPLWTQNDLHASNLFWSDSSSRAEVSAIIDFGLANRTNAVHDLATAIERCGFEWLRMNHTDAHIVHVDQIAELLAGYEELRPLSHKEAFALVAMLPLVHAEFALVEADYFLEILRSQEKADLAYEGYFLGHARWFQTTAGKRLLDYLEHWAKLHSPAVVVSISNRTTK